MHQSETELDAANTCVQDASLLLPKRVLRVEKRVVEESGTWL